MEYLREEKKEKKEKKKGNKRKKKRKKCEGKKKDTRTATSRIRIIVVGECFETSTQDVEVSQTIGGWREQERKASWVDWIKTIGKIDNIVIISYYLTIGWYATLQPCLNTFYQ